MVNIQVGPNDTFQQCTMIVGEMVSNVFYFFLESLTSIMCISAHVLFMAFLKSHITPSPSPESYATSPKNNSPTFWRIHLKVHSVFGVYLRDKRENPLFFTFYLFVYWFKILLLLLKCVFCNNYIMILLKSTWQLSFLWSPMSVLCFL